MSEDEVSERTRRAEQRREFRRLLDASSLGTPGAQAMRKRGAGQELNADEQKAADAELAALERDLTPSRKRDDP